MKKLDDMEHKLIEQEKGHDETIYKLERKAVVDKDRYQCIDFLTNLIGFPSFYPHFLQA